MKSRKSSRTASYAGRRKRQITRRRKSSTAGKILPPIDIRSNKHLEELKKRITKGPLTIVLVYADWCGHCHTMMPHFDAAAKSTNRTVQVAKVNETMLPAVNQYVATNINKQAKPLNVEGYPSIILVNNKGEKVTDVEPVRNTKTMTQVMNTSGTLANEAGLANQESEETVQNSVESIKNESNNLKPKEANVKSINKTANTMMANVGAEESGLVEGTPLNSNVGEEELKGSIVATNNKKNNKPLNLNSIPLENMAKAGVNNMAKPTENIKNAVAPSSLNMFRQNNIKPNVTAPSKNVEAEAEAITSLTAPVEPPISSDDVESISNALTPAQKIGGGARKGGSLMEAMARTTYSIATPAALLATAAFVMRNKKSRKLSKKKRSTKRKLRR